MILGQEIDSVVNAIQQLFAVSDIGPADMELMLKAGGTAEDREVIQRDFHRGPGHAVQASAGSFSFAPMYIPRPNRPCGS